MKKNKIIEVNEISESTKASLRARIISAIVGLIIAVPCFVLGDWFFFALIVIAAGIATYEIVKCAKPKHSIWLTIVSMILILLLTCWPMLRQVFNSTIKEKTGWKLWTSFETLYLSILILCISFMTIFFFVVVDKGTSVSDATFIFTIGVMTAFAFQCFLFLRYYPIVDHYNWSYEQDLPAGVGYFNFYENFSSCSLLVFAVLGTFMTDIGAYFTGVFFGKHKMNERISPKKTWEGFWGGIVFSILASGAYAFIHAAVGAPILSFLDLNHWYFIVILSIGIPFFATLGDFVFSSLKRHYGIKDFGNVMPGHGGILDRVDSLVFALIFVAVFVCMVSGKEIPLL
ncbi:MAG: phosphatidate cytidylyltransferase [Bacilli bacterium]|nr:phosphatidate cytidylyltransferase [Bacilli bacterium]